MNLEQRFFRKISKSTDTQCWEWTGKPDAKGYGRIKENSKSLKANRVSWILHNGEIPEDMCICHKCDNPICVNPDHLFLGSYKDNNRDRDLKNRVASGERQGNSKLTHEDVDNIRANQMNLTQTELGDIFGVKQNTISYIVNKVNWK